MKKIFLTLLTVLGVLGLASCNNPGTTKPKRTTITYCGWDLGTEAAPSLKREMINRFNENSDKIFIDVVEPQGGYDEFLNTMASASNLPDVLILHLFRYLSNHTRIFEPSIFSCTLQNDQSILSAHCSCTLKNL